MAGYVRDRFGDPDNHVIDDPEDDLEDDCSDDAAFDSPPIPLDPDQRAALQSEILSTIEERGCDGTLLAAKTWATGHGVSWRLLRWALQGNGGYCDCEVLMNVLPPPDQDVVGD